MILHKIVPSVVSTVVIWRLSDQEHVRPLETRDVPNGGHLSKPHDHDRPSDRHVTESFDVVYRVLGPQLTGRNKKRKRDETYLKVSTVSGILHKMKRSAYWIVVPQNT
ncbi:hypothetical protein AaE_003970 [Aphanomyces astaci]|uniref:Uncharacterized protein n=1 Tax=Aphanomyces astaci TaxID=112090 RepID=A0A6A5AQB8_APHAT|nr:hypothetical protein AaE_003970 [Aphanomyces astaci]